MLPCWEHLLGAAVLVARAHIARRRQDLRVLAGHLLRPQPACTCSDRPRTTLLRLMPDPCPAAPGLPRCANLAPPAAPASANPAAPGLPCCLQDRPAAPGLPCCLQNRPKAKGDAAREAHERELQAKREQLRLGQERKQREELLKAAQARAEKVGDAGLPGDAWLSLHWLALACTGLPGLAWAFLALAFLALAFLALALLALAFLALGFLGLPGLAWAGWPWLCRTCCRAQGPPVCRNAGAAAGRQLGRHTRTAAAAALRSRLCECEPGLPAAPAAAAGVPSVQDWRRAWRGKG